ncbi:integrase [Parashewanella spongiae]|uniref:Integrase n=1 Tax=Parashewanella spongiae TaxID=342950 RepID=A0A3A6UB00_9GAMM|nr:TnsA endonuclease N-terminal domain-containing protein [Parashewanella spongiae]MCL1076912.1 TnsA endonuclease N-terminal domain-containing protein [Parashewanella spongiae]RJY19161.1 integrase [Parashewanella spongiae]USN27185.1 transposon Tn7 transposition protein TnsA+TnsB [synthetic construct]
MPISRRNISHSRVKNLSKLSNFKNPNSEKRIAESHNEFLAAHFLNYFPIVKSFQFQPLAFDYENQDEIHSYTSDFLVELETGKFVYIEVKEEKALYSEDFKSIFEAKRAAARQLNKELILITENQYNIPPRIDNIKSLLNVGGFWADDNISNLVVGIVKKSETIDIEGIAYHLSQFSREEIFKAIRILILKREIYFDLSSSELTFDSKVSSDTTQYNNAEFFIDEFVEFDFNKKPAKNEVKLFPKDMDIFPEKYKQEALAKKRYIKWVERKLVGKWTEKNINLLLHEIPNFGVNPTPCSRSIMRWKDAYTKGSRKLIALVPKHVSKGRTIAVSEHDEFIEHGISNYLTELRLSINECYKKYETQLRTNTDLEPVSYNTFKLRIDKLPKYDVKCAREGKAAADIDFNNYDEHCPPKRLYEQVEIDHTVLTVILLDSEYLFPIGRPTLTVLIDKLSHCICGFYVSYEPPSYNSARQAILHSIKPKDYIKNLYPSIKNEWNCHGKIENLIVDNGAEFWSTNLEVACENWMNIQFNPVGKPWKKAFVERFIGTTCREFTARFKGKTFSNILEKMKYDPKKDAVMRFDLFLELFHKWIIDDYHQRADSRFKYIPNELWQKNYLKSPVLKLDQAEEEKLENDFLCTEWREWRKGGIHIFNLRYDSEYLSKVRKQYVKEGNDKKQKILVKYSPENINTIRIYIEDLGKYIEVPCVDSVGYTKGLSLFNHQVNLRVHRTYIKSKIDVVSLAEVRKYVNDRVEEEEEFVEKGRKKNLSANKARSRYKSINSKNSISKKDNKFEDIEKSEDASPEDWNNFAEGLEGF